MEKKQTDKEEVLKLYNEVNVKYKCNDIYIEGFTDEQIFYQIEDLCNKIIYESSEKIEKILKHTKSNDKVEEDTNMNKTDGHTSELIENKEQIDSQDENDDMEKSENTENSNYEDECSDDDSEAFEKIKKALNEEEEEDSLEEEDYESFSDEGSIENLEELKDLPACEIFKKLDKKLNK